MRRLGVGAGRIPRCECGAAHLPAAGGPDALCVSGPPAEAVPTVRLHELPHRHSPRQLARLAPLHLERPKVRAKSAKTALDFSASLLSSAALSREPNKFSWAVNAGAVVSGCHEETRLPPASHTLPSLLQWKAGVASGVVRLGGGWLDILRGVGRKLRRFGSALRWAGRGA